MEEFLPILIGIIWLVYTLYNRGQKKKGRRKPQPVENEGTKSPSFIEQLLMGEEGQAPQPYEYSEPEVETETIVDEFAETIKEKRASIPFLTEELSDFVHEGQSVGSGYEIEDSEDEKHTEFHLETNEFDLKKAVVFSEILNAPYIDYK